MTTAPASPGCSGPELSRVLFAPRSIALLGASNDAAKASSRPLEFLRRDGYPFAVYPVNRRGGEIGGERAYRSLDEVPEVPEHAFVMTPTTSVLSDVEHCGELGVKVVTVLSGGFGESGAAGVAREQELLAVARRFGTRIVGPNSLGMADLHSGLTLTANAAFSETGARVGGLVVASQSGSMIGALLSRGSARGLGFARMISTGAETDVSLGEVCEAGLDDPQVEGYLLFLESLRHADRLRSFALAAAERGIPVAAYKVGRSQVAAELAQSHTGAMAGDDAVAEAFLADCGIARVSTLDGLLEAVPLLRRVAPRAVGSPPRSVGVLATTGGGAAMAIDQLGVRDVQVVPASDETRGRLAAAGIDVEASAVVDLTLAGTRPAVMAAALEVLSSAPEFDVLLVVIGSSARSRPELALAPLASSHDGAAPVCAFLVPEAPDGLRMLADARIPGFRSPESSADVIAAALARQLPVPRDAIVPGPLGQTATLDEVDSYAELAMIPAAPHGLVDVQEPRLPAGVRYPVAVKAVSAQLLHKSDAGGVVLGVSDDEALRSAVLSVIEATGRSGIAVERVMVQEMTAALGEVIVGYRVDPVVGPLIVLGAGGTQAELFTDQALRMAPVDAGGAAEMISEVGGLRILQGYRGAPAGDIDALVALVVQMSELAHHPHVVEAELNPVMVARAGAGVRAVDAVVRRTST